MPLPNAPSNNEEFYIAWDGRSNKSKGQAFSSALEGCEGISHATSSWRDYSDLAPNVSGRPGLTRKNYESHRPDEATPTKINEVISACDNVYRRVGLIRNAIDLMSDFSCSGIKLSHKNKTVEKWVNNWWRAVDGDSVSERFCNYLLRLANVILVRRTGKLKLKDKDAFKKTHAADFDITFQKMKKREIPWKWDFYHPNTIVPLNGFLSVFERKPKYAVKIGNSIRNKFQFKNLKGVDTSGVPSEVIKSIQSNKEVPLPEDRTFSYFYKKDDWKVWANPMIEGILDDIQQYNKLRLADIAALDGAISNIRIFKLGNLEHKIAPTRAAAAKLSEILENHTGAGTMDLVWTPDIELMETNTNVHNFLGDEKYNQTLMAIYAGLGIPPTLTGTFGATGTTNNLVSLKTLIRRLEYVRSVLIKFWNTELEALRGAMGWAEAPIIEFTYMDLGDEAAEKALLIQLADRNLMSDELLQEIFNHNPAMENIRMKREHKERESGKRLPKSNAWYDPQFEETLKKIALQRGLSSPAEVGLELSERKDDELPYIFEKKPEGEGGKDKVPSNDNGRPKNSKDSKKRKAKEFKPKVRAAEHFWVAAAQEYIAEVVNPIILEGYGKKNMRSLSSEETKNAELLKFGVLTNVECGAKLTARDVKDALNSPFVYNGQYSEICEQVSAQVGRGLTIDERKHIQTLIYLENQDG